MQEAFSGWCVVLFSRGKGGSGMVNIAGEVGGCRGDKIGKVVAEVLWGVSAWVIFLKGCVIYG